MIYFFCMKDHRFKTKGFTLVELMVSVAIFTIVVVAVIGSVYTANASARKVEAAQTALNNVHFAMESMVRTIRTGTIISCTDNITLPDDGTGEDNCHTTGASSGAIVIRNTLGKDSYVKYYWDSNTNSIRKQELLITNGTPALSWGPSIALTSPAVEISRSTFNFVGLDNTSQNQRGASIVIKGFAVVDTTKTPFTIQTFVSQRNF